MSKQSLSIEDFGASLLDTKDLDPIYMMLNSAAIKGLLSYDEQCTWCVAYWCCYHAGVASFITEECLGKGPEMIWKYLRNVVNNEGRRWPRGTERRHFRGANGLALIDGISNYPTARDFVDYVFSTHAFNEVSTRVREHKGLGRWIAFKIADMGERVLGFPVSFDDCQLGVYEDPLKGAVLACESWGVKFTSGKNEAQDSLSYALNRLFDVFGDRVAPPARCIWTGKGRSNCKVNTRFCNVQEFETILCKWKSHLKGHYPLGKDTREIRHGLQDFGSLAKQLAELLPVGAN